MIEENIDPSEHRLPQYRHYYVDEAGDPVLFHRKGQRIAVGSPGCSKFFILGKLEVADPDSLSKDLDRLRNSLLADPYFAGIPSMQPDQKKTALYFHARDDVPEVRRAVFHLLLSHEMKFFAIIRDKHVIVNKVLEENQRNKNYRYHPNQLYDRCIPLLFDGRLHKEDAYQIYFARRGSSDRTEAFTRGLEEAKRRFRSKWKIDSLSPIEVVPSNPVKVTCLQAVDYFLWATQRCFEKGEHRYLNLLWQKVGLIVDRDDCRERGTGEYYNKDRPIPEGFR